MPRDVQIVRSAAESAPKDYTIPKDAEVILRAVKATFTDNGAGTNNQIVYDNQMGAPVSASPTTPISAGDTIVHP